MVVKQNWGFWWFQFFVQLPVDLEVQNENILFDDEGYDDDDDDNNNDEDYPSAP